MTTTQEQALDHLVTRLVAEQDERLHGVLPDTVLVGLLEGRLLPEVRAHALRTLVASDEIRRIALDEGVLDDLDVPQPLAAVQGAPGGGTRWWWVGAAAALALFAIGVAVTARKYRSAPDLTAEGMLAASVDGLRSRSPDLFEGFTALDAAARAAPAPEQRGGITLSMPRGVVYAEGLTFSWQPVPGATSYRGVVFDDSGEERWAFRASGTSVAYAGAPLRAGASYAWKLTAPGPLGEVQSTQSFQVASAAEQARYAAGLAEIDTRVAPNRRVTLAAHWGIYTGFLCDAYRRAREAGAATSGDPILRETWQALQRQLQVPTEDDP